VNCAAFLRWLDDGRPESEASAARTHARGCDACARQLDAALELDAALTAGRPASRDFTDRVMARVAETPQRALAPAVLVALPLAPVLPWWVRAAMQPATILAAIAAAVLLGWGDDLVQNAGAWSGLLDGMATGRAAPWAADPRVPLAVAIAVAPGVAWVSRRLYAWGSRLAS